MYLSPDLVTVAAFDFVNPVPNPNLPQESNPERRTDDNKMAKIDTYRQLIQDIIREHSEFKSVNEDVEAQLIFDPERDRYQLVYAGWSNKRRVYGCVMQLDLKNDKIWIQHDAIS